MSESDDRMWIAYSKRKQSPQQQHDRDGKYFIAWTTELENSFALTEIACGTIIHNN